MAAIISYFYKIAVNILLFIIDLFSQIYHFFKTFQFKSSTTLSPLLQLFEARKLSKVPNHLGIVIYEKPFMLPQLAQLLVSCSHVGIQTITIFDYHDILSKNMIIFESTVNHFTLVGNLQPIKINFCQSSSFQNMMYIKQNQNQNQNQDQDTIQFTLDKNEFKSKIKQLEVNVLNQFYSQKAFIETTRSICSQIQQKAISSNDITNDLVEKQFKQYFNFSDPELLLIFGPFMSTYGYPPWSLRLTEMLHFKSLKGFGIREFVCALHAYADCGQRFGT
eukprot:TRINITY_DN2633_c3_g1_i2.p1 TRINITY_DN2633_c3_g1~~TRINITY_DN2633_c3_g1_i2.p1  ORF type:complete len:277 (-),score=70.07 TRINITY_DN2633_c3_g1_i2:94-924(-)